MKTKQIMTRKMGEFEVLQRTSDCYFNATALLKQWNELSGMKKSLNDYFDNKATKEFISTIIERENLHVGNSPYVKSRASRGDKSGTWMSPILFIDFSMWINPSFKYDVIKFVSDQLVKYRNDAGDAYRDMSSSIAKIVGKSFLPVAIQNVARAVNHIVFGSHESEIRNKQAEEPTMKELFDMERKVSSLINEGFITNYDQLIIYLRKLWHAKWQPKCFA